MFRIGDIFWGEHESARTPLLVARPPEGLEPVGILLLQEANAATAPEFIIAQEDIAPPGLLKGRWAFDPWEARRLPKQALRHKAGCLKTSASDRIFRALGKSAARGHYEAVHRPRAFEAGISPTPVSGKCWGPEEMELLTDASLDFWLTTGRFNDAFEKALAGRVGCKHALTVNSGSSANLIAVAALCSPKLGSRRLKPGDEVITTAAGFPTTIAPLVQYGLMPVFVDAAPPTYNAVAEQVEAAIGPKTRAIFLAHTLGNPFDLESILALAQRHDLWLIEDACDALGSQYDFHGRTRPCGSFGHLATYSFYPAHHITMGEGGAVVCNDTELYRIALSMRDWGRDCWCPPGKDDSCKRRYGWSFPGLPAGYDHKYVYSHLGYNLKITDMQAAVGLAQLERLDAFTAIRRRNFARLHKALSSLDGGPLILPRALPRAQPSWFGFPVTLAPDKDRTALLMRLNAAGIGTRLLFAGNITRQPCFDGVAYRCAANLVGTDTIMRSTFWVGCYPGLCDEQMDLIAAEIQKCLQNC